MAGVSVLQNPEEFCLQTYEFVTLFTSNSILHFICFRRVFTVLSNPFRHLYSCNMVLDYGTA